MAKSQRDRFGELKVKHDAASLVYFLLICPLIVILGFMHQKFSLNFIPKVPADETFYTLLKTNLKFL